MQKRAFKSEFLGGSTGVDPLSALGKRRSLAFGETWKRIRYCGRGVCWTGAHPLSALGKRRSLAFGETWKRIVKVTEAFVGRVLILCRRLESAAPWPSAKPGNGFVKVTVASLGRLLILCRRLESAAPWPSAKPGNGFVIVAGAGRLSHYISEVRGVLPVNGEEFFRPCHSMAEASQLFTASPLREARLQLRLHLRDDPRLDLWRR